MNAGCRHWELSSNKIKDKMNSIAKGIYAKHRRNNPVSLLRMWDIKAFGVGKYYH